MLQKALLKLLESKWVPMSAKPLVAKRTWRIQSGEAAGLRMVHPQNLDFVKGSSELPIQRCLTQHLRPGGVFYDIGGNVGFFSLLAAVRVGTSGHVYALEPVPENAVTIRRNAAINGLDWVRVFEVAADETSGTEDLYLSAWDGGASLAIESMPPSERSHRRSVRTVALDDLVKEERLPAPTVVKIDVEGAEARVLRGMLQTIADARPVIIYEIDDGERGRFARRWTELDAFVASLGYRVTHLEPAYPNVNWQVGHSLAVPQ